MEFGLTNDAMDRPFGDRCSAFMTGGGQNGADVRGTAASVGPIVATELCWPDGPDKD